MGRIKGPRAFSPRVARLMMDQGFEVVATEPNAKRIELDVYIFPNTKESYAAMRNILRSISREKPSIQNAEENKNENSSESKGGYHR